MKKEEGTGCVEGWEQPVEPGSSNQNAPRSEDNKEILPSEDSPNHRRVTRALQEKDDDDDEEKENKCPERQPATEHKYVVASQEETAKSEGDREGGENGEDRENETDETDRTGGTDGTSGTDEEGSCGRTDRRV